MGLEPTIFRFEVETPYPLGHAVDNIFSLFTKNFNLITSVYIINILDWTGEKLIQPTFADALFQPSILQD